MTDKKHSPGMGGYYEAMSDEALHTQMRGSSPMGPDYLGPKYVLDARAAAKQERLTRRTYYAALAALVVSVIGVIVTILV